MFCVYLLLSSLALSWGGSPEFCKEPEREVIEPVSFLDGDYIIGALFSIGNSVLPLFITLIVIHKTIIQVTSPINLQAGPTPC